MIQTFLGTRLPTVMTASFAFTLPVLSIINDYSDRNFRSEQERFEITMRTIQGSLVVSSFLNSFIGFTLNGHLPLSSPRLVLITLLNSKLNKVAVQNALSLYHPLLGFPYPIQWGCTHIPSQPCLWDDGSSNCKICRAARLSGATPPPASVVSQSIDLQGVGMLLEGIFGGAVGTTASVENVGLLGLTHIGSRSVVQISTGFMFSIFGKFGAFFASIPLPIFAAMYCVLFGIVAAVGITFIQFANNNSLRNIYVLGSFPVSWDFNTSIFCLEYQPELSGQLKY